MISAQPKVSFQKLTSESAEQAVSLYFAPIHQLFDGLALMTKEPFVIKRALDIVISMCLLLVLFPPLLIIALLIKLDSPGPVFYISHRIGKNGRVFPCYKFRTMVVNADELTHTLASLNERDGILFKITKYPRATRIGRILRKFSLDELPQLFNVLDGDMSLVGPRPLLVPEYRVFNGDELIKRLRVRPGMASLWGTRESELTSAEWVRLDDEYVDRWSLLLDAKILARTLSAVLRRA